MNSSKSKGVLPSIEVKTLKTFYQTQDKIPKLINIDSHKIEQQKMDDYYIKL